MKINFSKLILLNIDGEPLPDKANKIVSSVMYRLTKNLDLVDVAIHINRDEEVELRDSDILEITRVIKSPEAMIAAFVKKAVFDFIDEHKASCSNNEQGKKV